MYEFSLFVFLAFVVWKAGDLINLPAVRIRPLETLVYFGAGVGLAEALQWNLFEQYGQAVTASWLGILLTGFAVGAAGSAIRTVSDLAHAVIHRVDSNVVDIKRKAA